MATYTINIDEKPVHYLVRILQGEAALSQDTAQTKSALKGFKVNHLTFLHAQKAGFITIDGDAIWLTEAGAALDPSAVTAAPAAAPAAVLVAATEAPAADASVADASTADAPAPESDVPLHKRTPGRSLQSAVVELVYGAGPTGATIQDLVATGHLPRAATNQACAVLYAKGTGIFDRVTRGADGPFAYTIRAGCEEQAVQAIGERSHAYIVWTTLRAMSTPAEVDSLAEATGLKPPAVSTVLRKLVRAGWAEEAGRNGHKKTFRAFDTQVATGLDDDGEGESEGGGENTAPETPAARVAEGIATAAAIGGAITSAVAPLAGNHSATLQAIAEMQRNLAVLIHSLLPAA